jgi:hypothetical protein
MEDTYEPFNPPRFASKAFAGIASFGIVSRPNPFAEAQPVWSTSEWKLASFEELLHEKAKVKQLFRHRAS